MLYAKAKTAGLPDWVAILTSYMNFISKQFFRRFETNIKQIFLDIILVYGDEWIFTLTTATVIVEIDLL